jgi:hypothetical protein
MAKYRKKPVVIEATQWNRHGDHPAVVAVPSNHPAWNQPQQAERCGWIKTLEGGSDGAQFVHPCNWIITGVRGEHYPIDDQIFRETYELVEPDEHI